MNQRKCVSIGKLYGGPKNQVSNLTQIPPGTVGIVCGERCDDFESIMYIVKFFVNSKKVWARCSPHRVKIID